MNYKFEMEGKWLSENYMNKVFGVKRTEKENEKMKVTIFYEIADVAYECATVVKYYMIPDDEPGQIFKYEYIKSNMFTTVHEVEGYVDDTVDLYMIKERIHGIILENIRIHKYEHNRTFRWIFKELDYVDATIQLCYRQRANSGRYPWKDTDYSAFSWKCNIPEIKNVIYNMPATIVEWSDGTKTISKCEEGEIFDREKGLMAAYMQKMESLKGRKLWKTLNKWLPKGLDLDKDPVNENMSTYVQSKLSRDHEKACKKLNKQLKAKTGKNFAEIWDSLPKDVKAEAESKIAEAVEQTDIDDDRTKEPTLEKKDQLNQEFDKLMNPPVDPKRGEHNTAAFLDQYKRNIVTGLVVSESLNDPDFNGYSDYPNSEYLLPGEATKWLKKYQHDIIVPFTNKRGTYYRYDELSYQKIGAIFNDIYAHAQESVPGVHRGKYDVNWEKIFGCKLIHNPVVLAKDIYGKNNKSTGKQLINFEFLKLLVVR